MGGREWEYWSIAYKFMIRDSMPSGKSLNIEVVNLFHKRLVSQRFGPESFVELLSFLENSGLRLIKRGQSLSPLYYPDRVFFR